MSSVGHDDHDADVCQTLPTLIAGIDTDSHSLGLHYTASPVVLHLSTDCFLGRLTHE